MFFRIDHYFDFIIYNTKNATLQKQIAQNMTSMAGAISEIIGNSVFIRSQNSFNELVFLFGHSFIIIQVDFKVCI